VRPPREMNSVRPAFHRLRAGHPQGRSEAEDPGGEAGGVDGRGRGGRLEQLRTGERLSRRGLAGPWARGNGGGGPRALRERITRARRRRVPGVAAARSISAGGGSRPRRAALFDDGLRRQLRVVTAHRLDGAVVRSPVEYRAEQLTLSSSR